MYKSEDRKLLANKMISFMEENDCFEGLVQIGSGAEGFTDIYSDIDMMAGCYNLKCVEKADALLTDFFTGCGAIHIEKRRWTNSAFGMSAYF